MLLLRFLSVVIFIAPVLGFAQGAEVAEVSTGPDFSGLVQFVNGPLHWQKRPDRNDKEKIVFRTFLHPGEEIVLEKSAYLKLISANRCVGAIYGPLGADAPPALVVVPENPRAPWRIEGSVRWVCPTGQSETLMINGQKVFVERGEFFFHRGLLLPLSGEVSSLNQKLEPKQTYQIKDGRWAVAITKDLEMENWKFNQELPSPKEGTQWPQPRKIDHTRWIPAVMIGPGSIDHPNKNIEINQHEFHAVRIMHHREGTGNKSNIFAATAYFMDGNDNNKSGSGPGPGSGQPLSMKIDVLALELGQRLNHERSWSGYWMAGFGGHNAKFDGCAGDCSQPYSHLHRDITFISLSAAAGIDKILFRDHLWGGLVVGVEAFYSYAAFRTKQRVLGGDDFKASTGPLRLDAPFSDFGLMLLLGPAIIF